MRNRNGSIAAGSLIGCLLLASLLVLPVLAADGRPAATNSIGRGGNGTQLAAPAVSAAQLLQCLLGPDVSYSNAVLSAAPAAAGTFTGGLSVIGFDSGIILSSGDISTLTGPNLGDDTSTISNTPGDTDLQSLVPGYVTYDAAVLEFDFTCDTAQQVVFQYVFGSEEYNEYVDTVYNDVFGFFLNGVNIALTPVGCSGAGIPVSINNVNCGNPYVGSGPNCDCFRNNDLTDGGGTINSELDGLTQVFFATGTIQAGTNHIKIAIADCGDQVLDSDVMIRCQSFTCGTAPVTGACCLPSGQCVTLTSADCAANGGTYQGDYSPCVPTPCGVTFGACCFADQTCAVLAPDFCEASGGDYVGDGTLCTPNPCGAATGACCHGDGLCDITDPFGCPGVYMGDFTSCDPNPCSGLTGACCADVGACEIKVLGLCNDTFLGVGTTCDPNPCFDIVGACCGDFGQCTITLEADCGDIYMGDRTSCDPNPCDSPTSGVDPMGDAGRTLVLGVPYPVPSRGQFEVTWSLPQGGSVSLTVWDAAGRLRATLFDGSRDAGPDHGRFTLQDSEGAALPSGVYWLKLSASGRVATQKVVLAN